MKKIWIVAPFTSIEENNLRNRFVYLANLLSEKGFKITLFTSSFSHFKKRQINQNQVHFDNFKILFINEPGYSTNVSFQRIFSHWRFTKNFKEIVRELDPPDLIYAAYPTMSAAYESEKYAKKNSIPIIIDVQDTWPESISAAFDTDKLFIRALMWPITKFANHIYKNADGVIGVSETYVKRTMVENSKSQFYKPIYIGSDLSKFDSVSMNYSFKKKENEVFMVYIGTLSHSYDIATAILGINEIEIENLEIKLYILGDGPDKENLQQLAKKLGVNNSKVFFKGYLDYDEMVSLLKNSDIALNAIKGQAKQTITNKLGDYLSAGLPILNSCRQKEIIDLVDSKNIGVNYIPGNVESLKKALKEILANKQQLIEYGMNSRNLAEERFDRKSSYKDILHVIKELI
ncbi:glycosyltransferase family 4 protein [Lysinibacillus pakistanensis]|uniref:glycosyltransferase family 4 protein n=1 Tax=Lysinibacillus pakistanensis TaxID=759811 RepID=UPI003D2B463C